MIIFLNLIQVWPLSATDSCLHTLSTGLLLISDRISDDIPHQMRGYSLILH